MKHSLSTREKIRLIWRSLWIQVLLNYKTMQGAGYLHILWPWLRDSDNRKNRVKRTSGFLNGHPVFSSFALGAMLRRLSEGDAESDPEEFDKWRESLAGPLGLVGDSLIWERWKPIVLTLGIVSLQLLSIGHHTPAWYVLPIILITVYNLPLLCLRWWALEKGCDSGKNLLSLAGHPNLPKLRITLDWIAAFAAALIVVLSLLSGHAPEYYSHFLIAFCAMFVLLRLRLSITTSVLLTLLLSIGYSLFI